MTEMPAYNEIDLIRESAEALGVPWETVPDIRRTAVDIGGGRRLSALQWGERPEIVFLHGGGQNAHTWDMVLLHLRRPALAIDLPGHGHSDWRADHDYSPFTNAEAVRVVMNRLAPNAVGAVGMSLGGLTTIRLAGTCGDLVRRAVVVDVTPAVGEAQIGMSRADRGTTALVSGPRSYPTFDEMLEAAAAASPHRDRESLQRGVLHNSKQLPDGRWAWRYDRPSSPNAQRRTHSRQLWEDLARARSSLTLVRGGNSRFVRDEDVAEWLRRRPGTTVQVVAGASHSVQSDAPHELARIVDAFLFSG